MDTVPTHPHDCNQPGGGCMFIDCTFDDLGHVVDWYIHITSQGHPSTVIGRYGRHGDYHSWPVELLQDERYRLARNRAGQFAEPQIYLVAKEMLRRWKEK